MTEKTIINCTIEGELNEPLTEKIREGLSSACSYV